MHKQPHRAVEKTADNRYWQNQFRVDDAELEAPAEFADYAPPTLPPDDAAETAGQPGNVPPK